MDKDYAINGLALVPAVWVFCYSFALFPWPMYTVTGLPWWCMPHAVTTIGLSVGVFFAAGNALDWLRRKLNG